MIVQFEKADLDYLAERIAEIITENKKMKVSIDADLKLKNVQMPDKLRESLYDIMEINGYNKDYVTLRDVAKFHPDWYKRLRGVGRVAHTKLIEIVAKAGLTWGRERLKFRK